MRRPWYMWQRPTVALIAGLGGLFVAVNSACAQSWAATGAPATPYWRALAVSADGSKLVAAGGGHPYILGCIPDPIFVSTNAGASWTQTSAPSNYWAGVDCSADGAHLVAVVDYTPPPGLVGGFTGGLIFTSPDMGQTWTPTSAPTNTWTSVASSSDGVELVAVAAPVWDDFTNYVGEGAIYRSLDAGATWTRTSAPSKQWSSVASSADGTKLVAVARVNMVWNRNGNHYSVGEGAIYRSSDTGATWTRTSAPINVWTAVASSADGVKLVAAAAPLCVPGSAYVGSIYVSTNSGLTWTRTAAPRNDWTAVASSADGMKLFAVAGPLGGSSGDCDWISDGWIYTSNDAGATWTATDAPIADWHAVACSADGNRAFAANGSGLLCSYPYSGPWRLVDAPAQYESESWTSVASSADGAKLVEGNGGRIRTSSDSGVTWQETSAPRGNWSAVASSADGTQLVAASLTVNYATSHQLGLIYHSTNSGTTWVRTSAPSNYWSCVSSSADGSQLAAAASGYYGRIYISSNSGASWTRTSAPANNWCSISSSADGTKVVAAAAFAGNSSGGLIYISSDLGVTWVRTTAPTNLWVSVSSSADGTKLVAAAAVRDGTGWGTGDGMIYTSSDSGATWAPTTAPSNNWVSVSCSADGTKLVAVLNDADHYDLAFGQPCIYTSTNSGVTWARSDSPAILGWNGVASSSDGSHVVAVGRDAIYVLQSPVPDSPLPPSPRLRIDRSSGHFALSWLIPSAPFVLQQSEDLSEDNWENVPAPPTLDYTNLHNRVKLMPSPGNHYYRLKQP